MPARAPLTIVAFGDSITLAGEAPAAERWPALLERRLRTRFPEATPTVVNAGVGGNTSREGLARMDRDVLAHDPAIVLVEFGGNDTTIEPERNVPLEEFRANLATMKARLDRHHRVEMIVLPFPPVVDEKHSMYGKEPYRSAGGQDRYIEPYRHAARAFARENGLPLADIDLALRTDLAAHILPDGVHLTAAGNRAVAEAVFPVLAARVAARTQA